MRAQRYSLALPVRYRPLGLQDWSDGTTENISSSGVLFRGERPLDLDAEIEIAIALLSAEPAVADTDLVCRARIVRLKPDAPGEVAAYAAVFWDYRFDRSLVRDSA